MAIAWKSTGPTAAGTGSSLNLGRPGGVSVGDLLVVVLGFEGVASGSGPWVTDPASDPFSEYVTVANGWKRICYQDPSASGCGVEVWAAVHGSGAFEIFQFVSSLSYSVGTLSYVGEYATSNSIFDGAIRGATTRQVTGDHPAAPDVYAFENELLIAVGADELQSPGWGTPTPSGWTSRLDVARSGYGTVEITAADKPVSVEGNSGLIPFPAIAASGATKGATATLAVRPAPPASSSPLIAVEFSTAN